MTKNIVFTDMSKTSGALLEPIPASSLIPEWHKKTESYIGGKKIAYLTPVAPRGTPATIKRCMPVFDAMTAGYLLLLPADIYVTQVDDKPFYSWSAFELVDFHPPQQTALHPDTSENPTPKFSNLWGIKTPKGYSILFITPMHRELPFNILPGVVDTDKYIRPVNFPFMLKDEKFEGLIPKGTPYAQVIPFKRDSWKMSIGKESDVDKVNLQSTIFSTTFFDTYKRFHREIKKYM
jgi:hypothetical protein